MAVQAVFDLVSGSEPEASTVGIALAAVSLVVMPTLAELKRRNGRRLASNSVVADSRQTMLLYLSLSGAPHRAAAATLTVSWWWADPLAALVDRSASPINEGREDAGTVSVAATMTAVRCRDRILARLYRRPHSSPLRVTAYSAQNCQCSFVCVSPTMRLRSSG